MFNTFDRYFSLSFYGDKRILSIMIYELIHDKTYLK